MNQLGTPRPRARENARPPSKVATILLATARAALRVVFALNASENAAIEQNAKKTAPTKMGKQSTRDHEEAGGVREFIR